jgi:NADH-quinone oxidoreductase E subunit
MLITKHDLLKKDIQSLVEHFGSDRSALMPVLQKIQEKHCYISEESMQIVADMLGIHPVEVYGVVSFYSFLDEKPKGQFKVRLCRTISCDMQGKEAVARQLQNDLGIDFGQTTSDGMFTLEWTNCMGMCDQGPAMLVNDQIYSQVTPDMVHEIIEECRRAFRWLKVESEHMEGHLS